MFKSCLSIIFLIAALLILGAGGFFLWDSSSNAKFERLPVDDARFAPVIAPTP